MRVGLGKKEKEKKKKREKEKGSCVSLLGRNMYSRKKMTR